MTNLSELKLSDLLPPGIGSDKEISFITGALDTELQSITACINEIVMLPRIDELTEDIIDSLAWQYHVDLYEPLGLDINKKRALVKSSLSWHRRKGTKSVLEEVIRILFFDDFKIEEWHEEGYKGEPYFFKLVINETIDNEETYNNLIRAIYELKNVRSWLEKLKYIQQAQTTIYIGATVKHVRKYSGDAVPVFANTASAQLYNGVVVRHVRKFNGEAAPAFANAASVLIYTGIVVKHVRRYRINCNCGGDAIGI